jgi:hypothetical protein
MLQSARRNIEPPFLRPKRKPVKKLAETNEKLLLCCLAYSSTLKIEMMYVPPSEPHDVTTQKTVLSTL